MDCQISRVGDVAEIHLVGSLDSSWSIYLGDRLDEVVRTGAHELRLNMAGVSYLSSNGIAFLLRYHRQLRQLGGRFEIVASSEAVGQVLKLTGASRILFDEKGVTAVPKASAATGATLELESLTLQVFQRPTPGQLGRLDLIGDPSQLHRGGYRAADERLWQAGPGAFAIGLGALGPSFNDCESCFGEFLAASGVAAYWPGDGTGKPDFDQAAGEFIPDVRVLYGLGFKMASGSALARFEAKGEPGEANVSLSRLVQACLDQSGAETAGIVAVAETDGLVGTALRRSPVGMAAGVDLFAHPEVRDWLSLTSEPEYARSTALIVGVASRAKSPRLAPFVRSLSESADDGLEGHFHAAAVPYRPLPRGPFELGPMIQELFETGRVETVLHLLGDSRPILGIGESLFTRGVFWAVPLSVDGEGASS